MNPVVIRPSGLPRKILLISLMFVVLGTFAIADGRTALGIAAIAFFGLPVVFLEARRWFGGPVLIIDDEGYVDRTSLAAPGRIEWSEVRRVGIYSVGGERLLAVEPVDPEAILARVSSSQGWLMRRNPRLGFEILNIAEISLPFRLERLIEIIRERNPGLIVGNEPDDPHLDSAA